MNAVNAPLGWYSMSVNDVLPPPFCKVALPSIPKSHLHCWVQKGSVIVIVIVIVIVQLREDTVHHDSNQGTT